MLWTSWRRFWFFFVLIIAPALVFIWRLISALVPIVPFPDFLAERLPSLVLTFGLAVFWFLVGTALAAQFLFPVQTLFARVNAWWCLLNWFIGRHRQGYIVRDGKAEDHLKGNRFGGWAGVILVDSSTAVVMDDGLHYTRTLGPNMVQSRWFQNILPEAHSSTFFIDRYEQVRGTIDLRRQRCMREVETITRDGIEVKCKLYVDFQIQRDRNKTQPNVPYTFDDNSVYQAVYTEAVRKDEGQLPGLESAERTESRSESAYRWTDAVITEGAEELRNLIAQYTLDQLYATDDPDRTPQVEIEESLLPLLQGRIQPKGVDVLNIMLGVFDAPKPVVVQRVQTWQTEWERRQRITLAQGESEQQRRNEIARAWAQLEMIENITKALPVGNDALSKDVVTLRLIQAIEAMAHQSAEQEGTAVSQPSTSLLLRQLLIEIGADHKEESK